MLTMTPMCAKYVGFREGITEFFSCVGKDDDRTAYLRESLCLFVDFNTSSNAFGVMDSFFDLYFERNDKCLLNDIVGMLKTYEERAALLTDSQRDHFVHSVNVFVLGICFFMSSSRIRKAFSDKCQEYEEFLFSWGIVSLLHDIGYPAEIVSNQAKRFFDIMQDGTPRENSATPTLSVRNPDKLSTLSSEEDLLASVSSVIADSFGLDMKCVNDMIHCYTHHMEENSFIDHGFYSAVMLLRWRVEASLLPRAPSGCRVGEQAAAILLHNYYGRVLMKNMKLGPMRADDFPLAFLLILCDELQEWNRRSYGIKGTPILPDNASIKFYNDGVHVEYRAKSSRIAEDFPSKKKEKLHELLDVGEVFSSGIDIICTCENIAGLALKEIAGDTHIPRLLADNIERLAISIHNQYNRNRQRENPEASLEHPSWEFLSQQMKYSNIRFAREIPEKLSLVGLSLSVDIGCKEKVNEFAPEEREFLARQEHDYWVKERVTNGWTYGEEKDVTNKISPYIADWDDIPPDIQKYDFEMIDFIIPAVESIGMYVYRLSYS